jgi:hypothetical protein
MRTYHSYIIILAGLLITIVSSPALAQLVYQPYSYQFYQKFGADFYSTKTRLHTSIKYGFTDSLLQGRYDSLMNFGSDGNYKSSLTRKILTEHQLDCKASAYTFYADLLPDFFIGTDFSSGKTTSLASLGAQAGGTIGSHFLFYGSIYYNQAVFAPYETDYINAVGYIPGQGKDLDPGQNSKNYYYSSFLLSYIPIKYINLELGKDKTFVGDGYRSMLLSDVASNYPFFRLTATLGNVKYVTMYTYMANPNAPPATDGSARNKWGYFQYFDWNVSNRVSLGFFQNVMEADKDRNGQVRGFNPSLAIPFTFLFPINNINNDPGKNLIGFTAKYKPFNKSIIYAQFALNEFHSKDFFSGDGSATNKSGYQIGFRGADLFHVIGLNYLAEYNSARPYTYSSFDQTSNYSQDNQPLASPFGANFREWLGILNYSYHRFDFQGQFDYAFYGLDINGMNYGQDIFDPYTSAVKAYDNYVGQGLRTDFYFAQAKVAYLINPKYNLRLELGGIYRNEVNSEKNSKTTMLTIGLRSSFRNIYNEF